MTTTHANGEVEGVGHELYMDYFCPSPDITDDLNTCGAVSQNRKEMTGDFDSETLKLKQGDILARVRGNLTAMIWNDK
jgi:hypothetical protein